jgi:hypothetical protein
LLSPDMMCVETPHYSVSSPYPPVTSRSSVLFSFYEAPSLHNAVTTHRYQLFKILLPIISGRQNCHRTTQFITLISRHMDCSRYFRNVDQKERIYRLAKLLLIHILLCLAWVSS